MFAHIRATLGKSMNFLQVIISKILFAIPKLHFKALNCIAAISLILFSTQAFALINFSVGVPLSHTFTGKYNGGDDVKSDGVSGTFVQITINTVMVKIFDMICHIGSCIINLTIE